MSEEEWDMAIMSGSAREQRPRQAILGQLARITRADGSPIRVLLVDDEPALTNLVKMALHPDVRAAIDLVRWELSLGT